MNVCGAVHVVLGMLGGSLPLCGLSKTHRGRHVWVCLRLCLRQVKKEEEGIPKEGLACADVWHTAGWSSKVSTWKKSGAEVGQ